MTQRALLTGRPHDERRLRDRGGHHRRERGPADARREPIPLTGEGFPAALPDAPRPSPVVSVSPESRARYPWLPARVIARSVWHGPGHARVRVDGSGRASPWPHHGPAKGR